MTNEWKVIEECPSYSVNEHGHIMRTRAGKGATLFRLIKNKPDYAGYIIASLHEGDKQKVLRVNRVVCRAFHGPAPTPQHHAAHNDGDRTNNHYYNLRWATRKENEADKDIHGTRPRGSRHANSKLKDNQIARIRSDGRAQRAIATDFGVSQSLVSMIKNGRIWATI